MFSNLDSNIVASWPEEDIECEIEDTKSITAKGQSRKLRRLLRKRIHTVDP